MTIPAALLQLTSLGLVWVFFHCAGMCGPIVGGMQLGGARALLLYQGGRMITLGTLGAAAGAVGARAAHALEQGGPVLALLAALGTAGLALRGSGAGTPPLRIGGARGLSLLWQRAVALMFSLGALRPLALGLLLGFLPCMIVVWALSLAVSSASPSTGALVMVTLVAMTTPTLALATLLPRAVLSRLPARVAQGMSRLLLASSSIWLLCVALAGFGVLGHVHWNGSVLGRSFTVMLY